MRPGSPGTGASHAYAWWVCPVKITSTAGSVPLTIFAKTGLAAMLLSSVPPWSAPTGAPSWYSATITSASPSDRSPFVSCFATRVDRVHGVAELDRGDPGRVHEVAGLLRDPRR